MGLNANPDQPDMMAAAGVVISDDAPPSSGSSCTMYGKRATAGPRYWQKETSSNFLLQFKMPTQMPAILQASGG